MYPIIKFYLYFYLSPNLYYSIFLVSYHIAVFIFIHKKDYMQNQHILYSLFKLLFSNIHLFSKLFFFQSL